MTPLVDDHHGVLRQALLKAHPVLCRLVPVVALLCIVAWCLLSLHSNFSLDDADSEILNQAWRLANGEEIYRDIRVPPFAFAAYTPLYYAFVSLMLHFTGLSFIPAKLLSFLAALAIGAAFAQLSLQWRGSRMNGLWAALFLFLIPAFLFNAIRCHPQMTAVAFSVWSLFFFLKNQWYATTIVSPLLAILAFYTKQTQIALPLAMILFLAIRNRRWLRAYVSTLVVAGVVPFLCLQWITEGKYFLNTIVQAGLAYNPLQIPLILIHHAGPVFLCIGLAMVLLWKNQRFREWREMDFYLAAVTGITIISVGRIGAHGQYVVEWVVISLLYLIYKTEFPFFKRQKLLVAIQILVLLVYAPLFVFVEEGIGNISSYVAAQKIYPLLEMNHKPYSGPILSQQGSFALFSNEGIYIQLFHFVGLVRADLWDQQRILTPIKKRIFPWVITEFPLERNDLSADDRERFTPEILEALRENYQRRMVVNPYYLYVPKYSTPTP